MASMQFVKLTYIQERRAEFANKRRDDCYLYETKSFFKYKKERSSCLKISKKVKC